MKKTGGESELNAQLRRLTADVRRLREELRTLLHQKRRSLKSVLDDSSRSRSIRLAGEDPSATPNPT